MSDNSDKDKNIEGNHESPEREISNEKRQRMTTPPPSVPTSATAGFNVPRM